MSITLESNRHGICTCLYAICTKAYCISESAIVRIKIKIATKIQTV